jgi:hypothetical protein
MFYQLRCLPAGILLSVCAGLLQGQAVTPTPPGKLAFILPNILDQALSLAGPVLSPLISSSISPRWVSLNSSVATQLSNLPNPSPASGTQHIWDPETGVFKGTPQSLGPILTERPETIGSGKLFFEVTNQTLSFDRLDRLDLRGFQVAYPIPSVGLVTADAYINVTINETTAHMTYGVTYWLDASFAMPIVNSSATVRGGATLRNLQTGATVFALPTQLVQRSSTGPGDGLVRLKATIPTRKSDGRSIFGLPGNSRLKLAMATDLRLPIGDEFDYHGSGAYGIKPFLIASLASKVFSPHVNAGFQWNGESYLASSLPNVKRHLPGFAFLTAGFDASLSPHLTVSCDFLGQRIIRGQRTLLRPYETSDGTRYSEIYFADMTRDEYNGSAGFKAEVVPHTVVTANVLFRLNQAGLRARVIPLLGISRIF